MTDHEPACTSSDASPATAEDGDGKANRLMTLRGVEKIYRMGDVDVPVLRDINLDVQEGEVLVVVGPSGSGKSTLLNLVGGIDMPTSGTIRFREAVVSEMDDAELTAYRREQIGFVFQFYNLVPTLTAEENVVVATELCADPLPAREALERVDMVHRADHFPAQLSGGEQQRVAIARAIAKRPELLLCDEPTGALDLQTGRKILGVLDQLNAELNTTILIITHNAAIAGLGHRVVHIGSGTIAETEVNRQRTPAGEITW